MHAILSSSGSGRFSFTKAASAYLFNYVYFLETGCCNHNKGILKMIFILPERFLI